MDDPKPQFRAASYEGRVLPRPDQELVDQGLAFDIGTLFTRRRMLTVAGMGVASLALAACGGSSGSDSASSTNQGSGSTTSTSSTSSSSSSTSTTGASGAEGLAEIPDETAGPYPGDGSNGPDVLTQSGVVRQDIRSSFGGPTGVAEGVEMTLDLTIVDMANGNIPFAGAAVYVWHCDREGRYSMYSEGITEENYLRGVQVADRNGVVSFTSIFPGCYSGRWPHIHFEVYGAEGDITDSTKAVATSQVALPVDASRAVYGEPGYESSARNLGSITLASDNVFGEDEGASQLGTVSGDVTNGYRVSLTVGVDTATEPTGGGMGGGGVGGGPGGPPPGR